jgi:CBS domain-containing protein
MADAVASHLGRFPPFDQLPEDVLEDLATKIHVLYLEADEVVFEQGEPAKRELFVVKKGLVALSRSLDEQLELLDLCDEGDLFGVRALLGSGVYSASARAREESLLYAIPFDLFEPLMTAHPRVAMCLAAGFAAELPKVRDQMLSTTAEARRQLGAGTRLDDSTYRIVEPQRDVVTCRLETSVQEAARRMAERRVGSILIASEENLPLGIVTDRDLRNKVLSQGLDPAATSVVEIMSSPVVTVQEPQAISALVARVMQLNLHHFCVTEDGTPGSPIIGIISEHDVLIAQGGHPTALLQKISKTQDPTQLAILRDRVEQLVEDYLSQEAAVGFVCDVVSRINDALIRSALAHARNALEAEGMQSPDLPFCWLGFGSDGREEQLLRTDLDNGIVYADPPPEQQESAHSYFVALGRRAVDVLVAAGFSRCAGDIMASNPDITASLSDWKKRFSRWIRVPEQKALMYANIFFDLRPLDGDCHLAQELQQHIFTEMDQERAFVSFLAHNALLNPPPLSFFRSFVVERSGKHVDEFDIKARAMMPLSDAARVLACDLRVLEPTNTVARFELIGRVEPSLGPLCHEGAMAYEILLRCRALAGLRNKSSGRYVDVRRMTKLERQSLRNTFAVIKDLQHALASRYRTDYFR